MGEIMDKNLHLGQRVCKVCDIPELLELCYGEITEKIMNRKNLEVWMKTKQKWAQGTVTCALEERNFGAKVREKMWCLIGYWKVSFKSKQSG